MSLVKSVYSNQNDILRGIIALHCPQGFELDATYGNGQFYREIPIPRLRFDIEPQSEGVSAASSDALPIPNESVSSFVFDPPFLTYVRAQREGNGTMVMANRFSGYWDYRQLEEHYRKTLEEAWRVLKPKGVLVFKCQDIVHNHNLHCTHANVIKWAETLSFRLLDLFVLPALHRMPSPNRKGKQKHARIFHSYFLVFRK